jgi:hypothetical protein
LKYNIQFDSITTLKAINVMGLKIEGSIMGVSQVKIGWTLYIHNKRND